jgi:dTDP-4-amino-4,6-dideoxygalactose transaminase
MKNFGFSDYDKVIHVGTNAKMSEFSAVTGVTNLESMEGFIFVNRRNFEAYEYHLRELRGLSLLRYNERTSPNYHYVVLEIDDREAGLTRDQLLSVLHAEGILARRYFYPGVHRMEPYRSRLSGAEKLLPQTTAVAERVLVLPTGTAVTPEDIEQICAILRIALQNPAEIRDALMEAAL